MSEQLKPCPICDSAPTAGKLLPQFAILREYTTPASHPDRYYWGCLMHTKHMAFATWNTRPSPDIAAENERLRELNQALRSGAHLGPIIGAHTIVEQEIELKQLRAEVERLRSAPIPPAEEIAAMREVVEAARSFVFDFEGDYVIDGRIVDSPSTLLLNCYRQTKAALSRLDAARAKGGATC